MNVKIIFHKIIIFDFNKDKGKHEAFIFLYGNKKDIKQVLNLQSLQIRKKLSLEYTVRTFINTVRDKVLQYNEHCVPTTQYKQQDTSLTFKALTCPSLTPATVPPDSKDNCKHQIYVLSFPHSSLQFTTLVNNLKHNILLCMFFKVMKPDLIFFSQGYVPKIDSCCLVQLYFIHSYCWRVLYYVNIQHFSSISLLMAFGISPAFCRYKRCCS